VGCAKQGHRFRLIPAEPVGLPRRDYQQRQVVGKTGNQQ
jgi:hypothetical protein